MKLGIMQPYFFPYLGHFALIAQVDQWIVFDVTQYTPRGWMNRNRILHPKTSWQYLTVPLANSSISILSSEARLLDPAGTRRSLLGKLTHYKGKAPHYRKVAQLLDAAFELSLGDDDRLVTLNLHGLSLVCNYLGLPFVARRCSELALGLPMDLGPGQWAPAIAGRLQASAYYNPVGGRELFDPAEFRDAGVELRFVDHSLAPYDTAPYTFEPGLSIIDVMLWNDPAGIRDMINAHTRVILP